MGWWVSCWRFVLWQITSSTERSLGQKHGRLWVPSKVSFFISIIWILWRHWTERFLRLGHFDAGNGWWPRWSSQCREGSTCRSFRCGIWSIQFCSSWGGPSSKRLYKVRRRLYSRRSRWWGWCWSWDRRGLVLCSVPCQNVPSDVYYNYWINPDESTIIEVIYIKLSYHWFLGQTTPLARLEWVGAIGSSHMQLFVPKTWVKFS